MSEKPIFLVSACLLGLCTRYDGKLKTSQECQQATAGAICIPFCPEQLGGLATPREAADIIDGDGHDVLAGKAKVMTKSGEDVTAAFIKGAEQAVKIAEMYTVEGVYLKARSPSCAVIGKPGVTAALLASKGYKLLEF